MELGRGVGSRGAQIDRGRPPRKECLLAAAAAAPCLDRWSWAGAWGLGVGWIACWRAYRLAGRLKATDLLAGKAAEKEAVEATESA